MSGLLLQGDVFAVEDVDVVVCDLSGHVKLLAHLRVNVGMAFLVVHFRRDVVDSNHICQIHSCHIGGSFELDLTVLVADDEVIYTLELFEGHLFQIVVGWNGLVTLLWWLRHQVAWHWDDNIVALNR